MDALTAQPSRTFKRWVNNPANPNSGIVVPVTFTIRGDLQKAESLLYMAPGVLQTTRYENAQNLPDYRKTVTVGGEGGRWEATIISQTQFGVESVTIYVPPITIPAPVRKRITSLTDILPAFEALDADGNQVGWVLCLSGTWDSPYLFVDMGQAFTTIPEFYWGNWPAHYGARPYDGVLPDTVFVNNMDNPVVGQLTDLSPHGETLAEDVASEEDVETGYVCSYAEMRSYTCSDPTSPLYGVTECAYFQNTDRTWGTADIRDVVVSGTAVAEARCSFLTGQECDMLSCYYSSTDCDGPREDLMDCTLPDSIWTALSSFYGNIGTVANGTWGDQPDYDEDWSTIDDTGGYGFLHRKEYTYYATITTDNFELFGTSGCGTLRTRTSDTPDGTISMTENIIIDGEVFAANPTIGPQSSAEAYDLDPPWDVYPRYYRIGDNTVYFLISISRYNETYGNRWQYGIFRSGARNRWLFNVEFPMSNADGTGEGPIGSHVIPGIEHRNAPVYCTGQFRLVRRYVEMNVV